MALRLLESFDHADMAYYAVKYNYFVAAINPAGRNGSCALTNSSWPNIKRIWTVEAQTWCAGFAFKIPNVSDYILAFVDQGTEQVRVFYNANTNRFEVWRYNNALLAQSAPGLVLPGVWYYLEFQAYIHNTLGSFELRLNGTNICSGSNLDTQHTPNAYANEVWLMGANVQRMDDLYVCDGLGADWNNFQGDIKVIGYKPNGAGAYSEWTPSAGANWQNVAEQTPDGDTTSNSTASVGNRDTYNFEDVTLTGSVLGMQLNQCYRKDDAGIRKIKPLCRSGGVDFEGTEDNIQDTYRYGSELYPTDPATGAAWTIPGINAAEFGLKLSA